MTRALDVETPASTARPTPSSAERRSGSSFVRRVLANRSSGMALAFVILVAAGAVSSPQFFTLSNGLNVAQQVSIIGIMAVGMTFVIVAGDIDLSIGSIYALSSVVAAQVLAAGQSMFLALLVGLIVGAVAGVVNGLIVVLFKIPSFIVTLGTLSAFRGLSLLLTEGSPISLREGLANIDQFAVLGQGKILGQIPAQAVIFLVIAILGAVLLTRTRFGFHVYAVGGSPTTSRLAGINVSLVRILNFAISGVLAALAGLIGLSFLLYVQGVSGSGLELTVITAVIVGGTALFGGAGSIAGTVIGVLIIGTLNNVLVLHGVSSFWQTTLIGVVIIAAVAFDAFVRRRAA